MPCRRSPTHRRFPSVFNGHFKYERNAVVSQRGVRVRQRQIPARARRLGRARCVRGLVLLSPSAWETGIIWRGCRATPPGGLRAAVAVCERRGSGPDPGCRSHAGQRRFQHFDNSTGISKNDPPGRSFATACIIAGQAARKSRAVTPLNPSGLHCGAFPHFTISSRYVPGHPAEPHPAGSIAASSSIWPT